MLLVEGFFPILPAGHSLLEILGGAIRIDLQVETFEGTVACSCEVQVLLLFCYGEPEKLQRIHVQVGLFFSYSDITVLAGVDLHNIASLTIL